nr:hypothetical protein [Candidatus Sigynarchaeota archaeon]
MDKVKDLERERDNLVKNILSLEDHIKRERTVSTTGYLEKRKELETRLIQVMDDLIRLKKLG